MEAVGYEMYLRLLSEAVGEEKGESAGEREAECLIDLQVSAHSPDSYIASNAQRLDVYRRIAEIRTHEVEESTEDRRPEAACPPVCGIATMTRRLRRLRTRRAGAR